MNKKMKTRYYAFVLCTLILSTVLSGCRSDDPGPTGQELTYEKLAGAWTLSGGGSVMVDGQDASLNYPGFSLSFGEGTYTTSNAGDLFRASGTWDWADGSTVELISVDDGKEVSIQQLGENEFVFSFTHSSGGAAAGTSGNYVITLFK